ncbi:MAG: UDP-N-acetylglucosamine--N-acetylmuramyl-(pentapeptide) pyrophosphoryl-undecaprenol N-acetylglucosamine transferase [Candidatus Liptonbacteria bacterium]|nr:UDP-N-acetylglucosamine--N-acetylmuramyl-(pentapeptide) pyrophosphoryl-undecaprenol N-acetylglucosamine transferase [Candidatus Liptonbacteria bacterium]
METETEYVTRVLFTGGGSGGHVYPLLAVAEELKRVALQDKIDLELQYLGQKDAYTKDFEEAGFRVGTFSVGKMRRYFSFENILDIPKFFIGLIVVFFKVFWLMPDVIFSKGGTGALPVVIAGKFYMIPVIIHESDAAPGLTNLLSARFASRIAVSFERAKLYFNPKKTAWIGTPVRRELLDKPAQASAKEAMEFDPKAPLVLIIGGSQGSVRINEFILTNLAPLLKETQVIHQTGEENFHEVERLARPVVTDLPGTVAAKTRYKPISYLDKDTMKLALSAADLVIARAGSGLISEISALGRPALLIPLRESASDHQRINAYEFAKTGAAVVIEEANLFPAIFSSQLKAIIGHPDVLQKMSVASQNFFKPGAAETIAREILRLAQ